MANDRQLLEEKSPLESFLSVAGVSETEFLPHLNIRAFIQLTRTNHGIHGMFAQEPRLKETLLGALMAHLSHIIVNEPTNENIIKLNKILNVYPALLTRTIKKVVFEQTGQTYINYSLLQLAYAEGDDELCSDVLISCFEQAFGSKEAAREEIHRQLNEKFTKENEEDKKQKKAEDLKIKNHLLGLLTPVIQAFTNEPFNNGRDAEKKLILDPVTFAEIATFREAFEALQPKMILKGRRFRLHTLQELYDVYVQVAMQWHLDDNRCGLFEDGVLSKALSYISQNDAMRSGQGLHFLQQKQPEPFLRRITLRGTNIHFYDCLRDASLNFSSLGGSCIDIGFGFRPDQGRAWGGRAGSLYQFLRRTKIANLRNLRSERENTLRLDQ